jgi:hypothetical protein
LDIAAAARDFDALKREAVEFAELVNTHPGLIPQRRTFLAMGRMQEGQAALDLGQFASACEAFGESEAHYRAVGAAPGAARAARLMREARC